MFSPFFPPGSVSAGLKTREGIGPSCVPKRLDASFFQGSGIVAATMLLDGFLNLEECFQIFVFYGVFYAGGVEGGGLEEPFCVFCQDQDVGL